MAVTVKVKEKFHQEKLETALNAVAKEVSKASKEASKAANAFKALEVMQQGWSLKSAILNSLNEGVVQALDGELLKGFKADKKVQMGIDPATNTTNATDISGVGLLVHDSFVDAKLPSSLELWSFGSDPAKQSLEFPPFDLHKVMSKVHAMGLLHSPGFFIQFKTQSLKTNMIALSSLDRKLFKKTYQKRINLAWDIVNQVEGFHFISGACEIHPLELQMGLQDFLLLYYFYHAVNHKTQLKALFGAVRVKLTDNVQEVLDQFDNPSPL